MIWTYNRIVKNKNNMQFALKNIDVQLKNRHDALPNIVATVQQLMAHETELHTKISALRQQNFATVASSEGLIQ